MGLTLSLHSTLSLRCNKARSLSKEISSKLEKKEKLDRLV